MKSIVSIVFLSIITVSCLSQLSPEPELATDFDLFAANPMLPNYFAQNELNGVYKVMSDHGEAWGDVVVCKYIRERLCIYSSKDAVFAESWGGFLGDSLHLSGIMRIVRSGDGARIKLVIKKNEGAESLSNSIKPNKIIIRGSTSDGDSLILSRVSNLIESDKIVIAHRGGCRNSERIGISENSIEMMKYAEILGADGIEIDVKRTKDDQLIIFHDDTFSPRTVQGAYLLGGVTDFTYNQIRTFGRLIHGEIIPTLDEALKTVIDNTNLSWVWLDIKDTAQSTTDKTISAQKHFLDYAKAKGRNIHILFGIPNQDILDRYNKSKDANTQDVLVEIGSKEAIDLVKCVAWGPRWTEEVDDDAYIDKILSERINIFLWTVDLKESIENCFKKDSKINGIVSNYPTLVSAIKYSKK